MEPATNATSTLKATHHFMILPKAPITAKDGGGGARQTIPEGRTNNCTVKLFEEESEEEGRKDRENQKGVQSRIR